MPSPTDFSRRIAASREELLAYYRRFHPGENTSETIATASTPPSSTVDDPVPLSHAAATPTSPYAPPQAPPFGNQERLAADDRASTTSAAASSADIGTGKLRVWVTAARQSIPIVGALVAVSKAGNQSEELCYFGETDKSGRTDLWELDAPAAQNFQHPNTVASPIYYRIRTYADGYISVENLQVPLYSGVTVVQNVNMIPLPEAEENQSITFTAGGPTDLS